MPEKTNRALIVGFGSIGKRHAEILDSLGLSVEVATRQPDCPYPLSEVYADRSLLEKYQYIVIANKTSEHASWLADVLKYAPRAAILVEKPLYALPQSGNAGLADLLRPVSGARVFTAYNMRFHPVLQKLRELISDRKVLVVQIQTGQYLPSWRPGRDYRENYSAHRDEGGGVLLDLSHEIDYLQWLFGKITRVSAVNQKISALEIDSDDICMAIGQTSHGILFNFSVDYLSQIPLRRITVQCEGLTIIADMVAGSVVVRSLPEEEISIPVGKTERNYSYEQMHRAVLGLASEVNFGSSLCTWEEGFSVMETISLIRNSTL